MGIGRTIKGIFNGKLTAINKRLQIKHCIELSDDYIVRLCKKYKDSKIKISELKMEKIKLENLMKNCESPELVETYSQHIIVLDKTLEKLASVLDVIKSKIESFEFQKQILVAKKNLLDDLIEIKNFSGGFLNGDFEIDSIISELDKNIKSVEIEIEANEELNSILKHK